VFVCVLEQAALLIAPHKNFIEVFDSNYIKLTATTEITAAATSTSTA